MNCKALAAVTSLLFAGCLFAARLAARAPERSAISGVAGIRLLAADLEKSRAFYGKLLNLPECRSDTALCFRVNASQTIEVEALGQEKGPARLVFIAFVTSDAAALRRYLAGNGLQVGKQIALPDGPNIFEVLDPEKHTVRFIQFPKLRMLRRLMDGQISRRMIHVGYVVEDRSAMDHFYKDLLGFRIYWHGGRKDEESDWVDMQVPGVHGTDWLEYMLNVPPNADHKRLGVMNHIALGVPDIYAAEAQLRKNGWQGDEKPHIGRDGKWQLNLYDPDDTRVEFMEFTPTQKPCCSEYTGPHPKP